MISQRTATPTRRERARTHPHRGPSLLNAAAVRRYVLDVASRTGRGDVVRRVGQSVYVDLDRELRHRIGELVHRHPGGFATLEAEG